MLALMAVSVSHTVYLRSVYELTSTELCRLHALVPHWTWSVASLPLTGVLQTQVPH